MALHTSELNPGLAGAGTAPQLWDRFCRGVRTAQALLLTGWKARDCSRLGAWVRVHGALQVQNSGEISLGDRVVIRGTHVPVELAAGPGGQLCIGEGTFINSGVSISAQRAVTIGKNCAIGNYTLIMDSDFHTVGNHRVAPVPREIVIEDDVWIAARVTILRGVRIGRGAVVAAGAVVTRDVAPYTLVGGVPARVIRTIDTDDTQRATEHVDLRQ